MKTRPTHFTRLATAAIMMAAIVATIGPLHAAKPGGGGGGGGSTPGGTIYFYSPPYQGDGLFYSMKADGTQKTPLGLTGNNASPSRLTHGGKRWFLQSREVPGEHVVPGYVRWEMFAVREDGLLAVQLTDDPAMQLNLDWTPIETGSDAIVAGLGQRWNLDGTPDVASIGVYATTVQFDANGNVIGLAAPPGFLVSVGVIDPSGDGSLTHDSTGVSFSPDVSKLVTGSYHSINGLRIIDVATGATTPLISDQAFQPAWSPDGTRIAFAIYPTGSPARIDVVSPNGTGRATVFKLRWANEYVFNPTWSPDSAQLAFRVSNLGLFTDEIYRVPVGGGKAVNLTGDFAPRAYLMGWR